MYIADSVFKWCDAAARRREHAIGTNIQVLTTDQTFVGDIAMAKHDPFGHGSGARREEQRAHGLRIDRRIDKAAVTGG